MYTYMHTYMYACRHTSRVDPETNLTEGLSAAAALAVVSKPYL